MSRWKTGIHPMLGKKHKPESLEKIYASGTLFVKGGIPWNKGLKNLKIGTPKGTKFTLEHRRKLSESRRNYFLKGGKPHNFKGNKDWENESIRHSEKYINWRRTVYIKDNYTCRECGHKYTNIVAHHIKSFSKYPELRFDIMNGMVLCRNCHCKFHKPSKNNTGLTAKAEEVLSYQ